MLTLTKNEMMAVLTILKSPEVPYSASTLSKVLEISHMGTLKILKRLEDKSILKSKNVGKSVIYRIDHENQYSKNYIKFLLANEAENQPASVKRWVTEARKIKTCDIAIVFGSVLRKKEPEDIDLLLVTDQRRFNKLKKETEDLNQLNIKKIHPVYQTKADLIENINKRDKVILNAIKGIVAIGEENFLEVMENRHRSLYNL